MTQVIPFESLKFNRDDISILYGLEPVDINDPASASSAVNLSLPDGFSERAHQVWDYFEGTAFLFEYKDQLVVTDESLWLTPAEVPVLGYSCPMFGYPRWVCNSWEELEECLSSTYYDLRDDGEI